MATIILDTKGKGWGAQTVKHKASFEAFGAHIEKWSTVMGYDDRWTVFLRFVNTRKYLAQCIDLESLRYNRIKMDVSSRLLDEAVKAGSGVAAGGDVDELREHILEDTAIHELLHVVIYPYTRFAERLERLAGKDISKVSKEEDRPLEDELREREEEIVSRLEIAFSRRCHPRGDERAKLEAIEARASKIKALL